MKKNLYKLFSFAVLATLIISCGGESNPLIKKAKEGIAAQNYQAAITSLNQAIDQDSSDADAYYYKGLAYGEMAEANPVVSERKEAYQMMRDDLMIADEWYTKKDIKSFESVEAQLLIDKMWSKEHNLGVQYATGDSSIAAVEKPLDISEDHLENAIIINPDSLLSYEVLAEVYRLNSNTEAGISIYEQIIDKKETADAYDYDRLGSLYIQAQKFEKANTLLATGVELYPDSITLVQKLADSYANLGMNQESIEVIESLIERDPNNAQYHLVLGTQVYIMANQIDNEISSKYDEIFTIERSLKDLKGAQKSTAEKQVRTLKSEIAEQEVRSNELTDKAIEELKMVIQMRPTDSNAFNTLGIIYQNKAAALYDKRNATTDNDAAAKIDAEAQKNLREAMTYYEKATEIEPENQNFWKSLFQVYTQLGMNDKAEAAMEKAGM